MVDEAVGAEDVERQILVWMGPAFAIPLLTDGAGFAIGVEQESLVGRRQHITKNLSADFGGDPEQGRIAV